MSPPGYPASPHSSPRQATSHDQPHRLLVAGGLDRRHGSTFHIGIRRLMWTVRLFVDAGVYSSTCMVVDVAPQARLASSHVSTITHGEGRKHEDVICGLGGNDIINGSNGNDTLDGRPGNDMVNGGNGDDTCTADPGDITTSY
jgi:hypothetical protein